MENKNKYEGGRGSGKNWCTIMSPSGPMLKTSFNSSDCEEFDFFFPANLLARMCHDIRDRVNTN